MAKSKFPHLRTAFTLSVIYKDGVEKTIPSVDRCEGNHSPWNGLLALETHAIRYAERIREAKIFYNTRGRRLIRHFVEGKWLLWEDVEFKFRNP